MMKRFASILVACFCAALCLSAQPKTYNSYKGLVMAGYQGWFDTPEDGSGRGWYHYNRAGRFEPGYCTIDLWPDTSEYPVTYETAFRLEDGTPARIFSSQDPSTVDVHFRWMKEYGLDGVFMQRFVTEVTRPAGKLHFDKVLASAMDCANKYERAIAVMYDLSGMPSGGDEFLLKDIAEIAEKHALFDHSKNPSYLYHNGKPLVAVWGIGFNDNRKYGFREAAVIINGLRKMGFSIMIGVPTRWRELTQDTISDKELHRLIRKCDVVMPWFVGRYNPASYAKFRSLIDDDIAFAKKLHVDYAPLCFPGFSWDNMQKPGRRSSLIPRLGGAFLREQLDYCIDAGAEMIYVAMFDEIDEGTAIFKLAKDIPVGQPGSTFVPLEDGVEPDTYLKIVGEAAARLKK